MGPYYVYFDDMSLLNKEDEGGTDGWYPVRLLSPPQVIVSVKESLPASALPAPHSKGKRAVKIGFMITVKAINGKDCSECG